MEEYGFHWFAVRQNSANIYVYLVKFYSGKYFAIGYLYDCLKTSVI